MPKSKPSQAVSVGMTPRQKTRLRALGRQVIEELLAIFEDSDTSVMAPPLAESALEALRAASQQTVTVPETTRRRAELELKVNNSLRRAGL